MTSAPLTHRDTLDILSHCELQLLINHGRDDLQVLQQLRVIPIHRVLQEAGA